MVLDQVVAASIQDPVTLAAVSGLVSGTASGFMSPAIKHGLSWISDRYKGHPKDATKTAQNNAINFFGQVNICLEGQQQIQGIEDKTKQALADPDYTSLFQEAVLGAARTNSEQKHKLLARLVTDRLTAEPDSLQNLAAHTACNAVLQLTSKQLKILGAIYVIRHLPAPQHITKISIDADRINVGIKWFLEEITPFYPIRWVSEEDLAHMASMSCIAYVPQPFSGSYYIDDWKLTTTIKHKLCPDERSGFMFSVEETYIRQNPIGEDIWNVWDDCSVRRASPTPAGTLIGMCVRDVESGHDRWPPTRANGVE